MRDILEERGFSLVEVLLAAAISSIVIVTLGTAVHQFFTVGERARDSQKALQDVRSTGHWLNLDGKKATSTDLVDGASPVNTLSLNWSVGLQVDSVEYYLSGNDLSRDHNGTVISVARNITNVEFSRSQDLITVSLTSVPAGRWNISKHATYHIWLRGSS